MFEFMPLNLYCLFLFCLALMLIIILIWQEGEDLWEDDCSVSESSSICGPNISIREFNNPHYSGGDSGSNQDGKVLSYSFMYSK